MFFKLKTYIYGNGQGKRYDFMFLCTVITPTLLPTLHTCQSTTVQKGLSGSLSVPQVNNIFHIIVNLCPLRPSLTDHGAQEKPFLPGHLNKSKQGTK